MGAAISKCSTSSWCAIQPLSPVSPSNNRPSLAKRAALVFITLVFYITWFPNALVLCLYLHCWRACSQFQTRPPEGRVAVQVLKLTLCCPPVCEIFGTAQQTHMGDTSQRKENEEGFFKWFKVDSTKWGIRCIHTGRQSTIPANFHCLAFQCTYNDVS